MTDREWQTLDAYVRAIADDMGLRDWDLTVLREPTAEEHYGSIIATYGRKIAQIRFCSKFRVLKPTVQRETVVHELVHCHFESAHNMVKRDLEEHLGSQTDMVFFNAFKRQFEYGIDGVALALSKHLPLIEWPAE